MRHLVLLLVIAPLGAAWAAPLAIDRSAAVTPLFGHIEAALDGPAHSDVAQARRATFEPVGPQVYSRPPGGPPVWLRAQVHNPSDVAIDRLLVLRFRLLDHVMLAIERADGRVQQTLAGEDTDLSMRAVDHPLPVLPFTLHPGETVTLWIHIRDPGAIDAPLDVGTWGWLARVETERNLVHGLFMGSIVVLMLFGLILAIARRSRLYGWFAGYLAAELFLCLIYFWGGFGALLTADLRPLLINRGIVVGAVLMFWMSMSFATRLMDLDTHAPRTFAWLRRTHLLFAILLLAVAAAPYQVAIALSAVALGPVLVPIAVSVKLWGVNPTAKLYTLSWGVLLAAVLAVYLRVIGVVPADFPTEYLLYAGFFLQFSVLVAAISRRMRAIEQDQRRALEAELAAYQRNAALSRSFERFVPKAFLDRLERTSITEIELGHAVSKRMTVLFSDIRSFTSLVEHMSPEENFAFINEYLGFMEPAIHQHLGFIDKYIGDAVMALFDDESDDSGGALQAVQAAIGMHEALARYNALRVDRGDAPVSIGIGLHTGALMLGTIGGRDRLNASVIGDSVNLASRVEGLTKRYGAATLLSGPTVACLPKGAFALRLVDRVRVKGKTEAVAIYQLLDCERPTEREKRIATRERYEAARAQLTAGEVEAAHAAFETLRAEDPTDVAVAVQIATCARLLQDGLPDGWDGAVKLDAK